MLHGTESVSPSAVEALQRAAEAGDARAMSELGDRHRQGQGVVRDDAEAVRWFQKGAEAGDPSAMTRLGEMYAEGRGMGRNEVRAVRWFQRAAEAGDAEAMGWLGEMYAEGRGVGRDDAQALHWVQQGAAAGDAWAMYWLGVMYQDGRGVARDATQAVHWFQQGARAGNAWAMYELGTKYASGQGVARDEPQALHWVRRAAEAGDTRAMVLLSETYHNGWYGVTQDEAQALHWDQQGAAAGDTWAMYELGTRYASGQGVAQDEPQAVYWFQQGAAAGDAWAMTLLGTRYASGQGVARDEVQATHWFQQAAKAGHTPAMTLLGTRCASGQGVAQDEAQAVYWYQRAAEAGDGRAMYGVAMMYRDGRGVARDEAQAAHWFRRAANRAVIVDGRGVARDAWTMFVHMRSALGVISRHDLLQRPAAGVGVTVMYGMFDAKDLHWFRRAAEAGDPQAMAQLGFMYAGGLGVAHDEAQAAHWFQRAAEAGDPRAMAQLLALPQKGEPITKSPLSTDPIRQAQEQLKSTGFDPGPMDGTLGPRTKQALRQYQRKQGLNVTGVLDEATRVALGIQPVPGTCVRGEHSLFAGRSLKPAPTQTSPPADAGRPAVVGGATDADIEELRAMLASMRDIAGIACGRGQQECVLFGPDAEGASPLHAEDWIVAFQSIYAGQDPAVSIDPGPEPQHMVVRYFGPIEYTHFGLVLFEADRLLKLFSSGYDNTTCTPFRVADKRFKTKLTLLAEQVAAARYNVWERHWFVPHKMVIQEGSKAGYALFLPVPVQVRREVMEAAGESAATEPAAQAFVSYLNDNYDSLAREQPVLADLRRLAKFVAIARWFADRQALIDEPWLKYRVQRASTPSTTPAITAVWQGSKGPMSVTLGLYGGVDLSTPNTYLPEPSHVDPMVHAALTSRPQPTAHAWEFEYHNTRYRAWAYRYVKGLPIRRSVSTQRTLPPPERVPVLPWIWAPGQSPAGAASLGLANQSGKGLTVWLIDVASDRPVWTTHLRPGGMDRQTVSPGTYKAEIVFDEELDAVYEGQSHTLAPNFSGTLTIQSGIGEGLKKKRSGPRPR